MTTIHKSTATESVGRSFEFVMSDGTRDRYGDIVDPAGWMLTHFKRNPVALFGHQSSFPIGRWSKVRVENGRLLGKLDLADPGTSPRIDEIRSLIAQDILVAVSVGFRSLDEELLDEKNPYDGVRYKKQELLECSVCAVGANPAALNVAKELGISPDTLRIVFGEHAEMNDGMRRRGSPGEHAASPPIREKTMTISLSKRIEDAQADLLRDKDALTAHIAEGDADATLIDEFSERIETKEAGIASLVRAEKALAAASTPANTTAVATTDQRRPFAVAAKKVEPKDYVYRSIAVTVRAHIERAPRLEVLRAMYGEDETTRAVFDVVTKAATAPAMTTTTGWAAELVQTAIFDFIESMMPNSVYPKLSGMGGRFAFGQNGIVSLPSRSSTPTIAGSFVGQGAPIPVRQGAFTATTLTPKKMAVITPFTREMAQHSTPALEGVLRSAIQEDTAVAIDTVLLDATAASAIRPAGLRNSVSVTTATAGGTFTSLVTDIKNLLGALITGSSGNLRQPVWIMNPVQAISIGLIQNAGGDFPFAAQIERGTLQGYPVIQSSTVTAGMMIIADAADFFSATGDEPRFDVSDQAVIHQEDTTPLQISSGAQGSGVLATPVRSLWQTDSLAIRMILDMNWALRRTGTVAWTQSVSW